MTRAPAELRRVADLAAKVLATAGVPGPGDRVAVAVSGGADSLALLYALRVLARSRGWRLAVLTVDHGLRPGSAADAAFVADHAKSLGLPARLLTLTPADLQAHRAAGPEGAARGARYGALWPAADELGCRWLATGHTLDDQAETVLLQLLRGAGPDGLAGMAVRAGGLLRPLLGVRRAQTRACCTALSLAWREDPTNAGQEPLRNRVRTQLLPLLEHLRPGATQTLARTATLAADDHDWLEPLVKEAVDNAERPIPPWATLPAGAPQTRGEGEARPGSPGGHGVALDAATLAGMPVGLGRRVVRAAAGRAGLPAPDAGATDRVLALARADGTTTAWPGGVAVREGPAIRLRRRRIDGAVRLSQPSGGHRSA
jgi:tRNA(Ile)-lysidine synthase